MDTDPTIDINLAQELEVYKRRNIKMRVRLRKRVIVGSMILTVFLFWMTSQPVIRAAVESGSPDLDSETPLQLVAFTPIFIIVVWPLVLAGLEAILNTLASTSSGIAEGERKFRIRYQDGDSMEVEISPVSVDWLRRNLRRYTVREIERLPSDSYSDLLNLGIDLCISAMATDLAAIAAIKSIGTTDSAILLMVQTASVLVIHFIAATGVTLALRTSNAYTHTVHRTRMWVLADIIGVFALISSYVPFIYL